MKRAVFIDGSQGVGKTSLIKEMCSRFSLYEYKFPFSEYTREFNLYSKDSLKAFQLGKDLASLYFLSRSGIINYCGQVIDRGPFSSIYYSLATGRMTIEEVDKFFSLIATYRDKFSFVFVVSTNSPEMVRSKQDGFDSLKSTEVEPDKAMETMMSLSDKYSIKINIFKNDFSDSIKNNSYRLYKLIKEDLWK